MYRYLMGYRQRMQAFSRQGARVYVQTFQTSLKYVTQMSFTNGCSACIGSSIDEPFTNIGSSNRRSSSTGCPRRRLCSLSRSVLHTDRMWRQCTRVQLLRMFSTSSQSLGQRVEMTRLGYH